MKKTGVRAVVAAASALSFAIAVMCAQPASARTCFQPDGPGTPFVCTAPR